METFLSGYCRCLDKARIVLVEDEEADCEFAACPHRMSCEIAKKITEFLSAQALPFVEGG